MSGPFTGGSSSMGLSMRDGVRLAVDEINKSGGFSAVKSLRSNATTRQRMNAVCRSRRR